LRIVVLSAATLLLSCRTDSVTAPASPDKPFPAILDGAHGEGRARFFFLPPTVLPTSPLSFSGTFDGTLSAAARVCIGTGPCGPDNAIAAFTSSGGTGGSPLARLSVYPRWYPSGPVYAAVWDTRQCASGPCTLSPAQAYRLHVYATNAAGSEVELGLADITVVLPPAPHLPSPPVDLGNYSPLVPGWPYVIAFRIEQGVVGDVQVSVTPGIVKTNATGTATATVSDLHGAALSGRTVIFTTAGVATTVAPSSGPTSGSGQATTTVTAGATPGTATITATTQGLSRTAVLTVTAPGIVLVQEGFEDNAFLSRDWYDNSALPITDTEHVTGSTHALEVHYTAGARTPTWGGPARHLFQATPTVYVGYWVKYSTNWVGSSEPFHPHEFNLMSDLDGDYADPANGWLVGYIEHNYRNGGVPRLAMQDNMAINTSYGTPPIDLINVTENRSTSGCNGVVESNVLASCYDNPPWYNAKIVDASQVWFQPTPGPGYKGDWNHVEVYLQLNSVVGGKGVADGVMQYWFNGALAIDRHDILYRTGARPTIQFRQFLIAPYMRDGSPVDQYMWIDDLIVATGKP